MPTEVVNLRRYPVKSMGGEGLPRATLDHRGLVGDRWWAVEDEDGRFASGKDTRRFRRRDAVFAYAAAPHESGDVTVRGPGDSGPGVTPHSTSTSAMRWGPACG